MKCEHLQYSELFFFVVDVNDTNPKEKFFLAQCLLCGEKVKPFSIATTSSEWNKWRGEALINHLVTRHNCSCSIVNQSFSSITNLNSCVKTVVKEKNSVISFAPVSKRQKLNSDENPSVSSSTVEENSLAFTPIIRLPSIKEMSKLQVTKLMRVIAMNLPLTSERNELYELYWKDIIPGYDTIQKLSTVLYDNMKIVIKSFLSNITHYSISFDCWSTYDVGFKAICFFAHVYQEGHYRSLLLDVKSMEDSTSASISNAFQEVTKEYQLNTTDIRVVGDNASSNVSAFKNKLTCFAHAFNTACSHLIKKTEDSKLKIGLGTSLDERKKMDAFFSIAETVCGLIRGSAFKKLCSWHGKYKDKMDDLTGLSLKKPNKPCETRWLERINHFEYLRKYGVLIFRVLCCTQNKSINLQLLHDCLVQLPEILFILNAVNNSLQILAFEKKATAHLVLPILNQLKDFFKDCQVSCAYEIPKLMAKSFLYELNYGCLKINDEQMPYYQCASACFFDLQIIDKELMKKCVNTANIKYEEFFNKYYPELCIQGYDRFISGMEFDYSTISHDMIKKEVKNAIFFREGGAKNFFLFGELYDTFKSAFRHSFSLIPEIEVDQLQQSNSIVIKKKSGRPKKNATILQDQLKMIENWKSNGGAEDDNRPMTKLPNEKIGCQYFDVVMTYTSDKKSQSIFINPVAETKHGYQNKALRELYEYSLCTSPTEADCERFFRILSLFVKKQYRTNMKASTWCTLSFLKYYGREIYYLFGQGRNNDTSIEKVLLDI